MKENKFNTAYIYIFPACSIIFFFMFYPIIKSLYLSFTNYVYTDVSVPKFILFKNYINLLFKDTAFLKAFKHTCLIFIISFPLITILSLIVAVLLNEKIKYLSIFRTAIFLPLVIPGSQSAIIWQWIYSNDLGILNNFLQKVHLGFLCHNWLGDPKTALFAIIAMSIWSGIALNSVLFLGGLIAIPEELYEAGDIDGTNWRQRLVYITVPLLKGPFILVSIYGFMGAIKIFTSIWIMTGGGPADTTEVLYTFTYKKAFMTFEMGYACASAYIMAIIILLLSWLNMRLLKTEKGEL